MKHCTVEENVWYFDARSKEVDTCCRHLVSRLIGCQGQVEEEKEEEEEEENMHYIIALLSNWIRIYVALFHYEQQQQLQMSTSINCSKRNHTQDELSISRSQQQQFHQRCCDIGLCGLLQKFTHSTKNTSRKQQEKEKDKEKEKNIYSPFKQQFVQSFQTFIRLIQVFQQKIQCNCSQ
jgi:hypothetical protein